MRRVLLVQPWNYHDENVPNQDLSSQWRNGPYNILSLATYARRENIEVQCLDLQPVCVRGQGKADACLRQLSSHIESFRPDIIAVSFFSYQLVEAKTIAHHCRELCRTRGLSPSIIAGGIHATIEPRQTIEQLGFDFAFVGEGESAMLRLGHGEPMEDIPGMVSPTSGTIEKGEYIRDLDALPFTDWGLCDHPFYSYPSSGKVPWRKARTLDVLLGRGCINRCAFCAYSTMGPVRFHSAEYMVEQILRMRSSYHIDSVYFIDSSIGNNRKLLVDLCERMIKVGWGNDFEWYANMRSNQVDEDLLRLMWDAGCRSLFYGFESGSQRMLDAMNKRCTVEQNMAAAQLHNRLGFFYHASMLVGFPGETEEDILQSVQFLHAVRPPRIGINWYVPLPGSDDYANLKGRGALDLRDIARWRKLGEVLPTGSVYAAVEEARFRQLFSEVSRQAKCISASSTAEWMKGGQALCRDVVTSPPTSSRACRANDGMRSSITRVGYDEFEGRLRDKWRELPGTRQGRIFSRQMLDWSDQELLAYWEEGRRQTTTPEVRAWFQQLYKDEFAGKEVADIGPGIGVDGIFFARHGAKVTFVDIVQDNLTLLERICRLKGIEAEYYFVDDFFAFHFSRTFDVFMAIGSLLNAPFDFMKREVAALSPFLRVGGKVVMLAYPKERYIQLGARSFEHFAKMTDGERTPWAEWYDDEKTKSLFGPAYRLNWSRNFGADGIEFNWFDLTKISCEGERMLLSEGHPAVASALEYPAYNATSSEFKARQAPSSRRSIVGVTHNDDRNGDLQRRTQSLSNGLMAQGKRPCSAIEISPLRSAPIGISRANGTDHERVLNERSPVAADLGESSQRQEWSPKENSGGSTMNIGEMVKAGVGMYEKGDVSNAVNVFRHAVAVDPSYANAWNNLGVVLVQQNQVSEGLECLRNGFERNQANTELATNYVTVLRNLGRPDEAGTVVDQYVRAGGDPQCLRAAEKASEPTSESVSLGGMTIPVVPVRELHRALGFAIPIEYPQSSLTKPLAKWKMEIDDSPIFRYLYRHFRPTRHLEFGTWQGAGVVYCLEECEATVWTLNLPFGETRPGGETEYSGDGESYGLGTSLAKAWARRIGLPERDRYRTDSFGFIGRFYLEKQLGHRVCQILCDSRQWDVSPFPVGFFDTALIDGGHFPDVVASDTEKALGLLRPGGLMMWHDFCPPMAKRSPVVQGVMQGLERVADLLGRELQQLFWIKPSHILVGRKRDV